MNRTFFIVILFAAFLAPTPCILAQSEANIMANDCSRSYDSLLNTYYVKKFSRTHARRNLNYNEQAFENVSDSVIANRLKSMHTVIPMNYNNIVRQYIKMYLGIMSRRLDVTLTLSEYYHPMFIEILSRYGVPEELKYLSIIESAMNPQATSRVGAAGLWQFMYYTGKLYGLEVNSLVDDRRDPYKSTVAAARYLKDLHNVFNDWTLAIAAYNCGPGNINKAIARSGGKHNFWEIYPYLPRETRGYIPAFIAATYVMNHYADHGLRPSRFDMPINADTIVLHNNVYFKYISDAIDIDIDELRALNPQYITDYIPGESGTYTLTLPINKMQSFFSFEEDIYSKTNDSLSTKPIVVSAQQDRVDRGGKSSRGGGNRYHSVRKGETLTQIAQKYGTTVQALKKKNKIKGDKIRYGQKIRVK
ncbi:MAG: transglycosylase SLT domain-containing protein [Bacteroidales bacterium]|nr:transglycosylase SLT domain-containing protein [Candidatus Colimorpha onthohippi]